MMEPYVSKATYADYRGISRPAVTKLIKDGKVIIDSSSGTDLVDVEASDIMLDHFSNPSQGKRPRNSNPDTIPGRNRSPGKKVEKNTEKTAIKNILSKLTDNVDYSMARALLTKYSADLKKLELDKELNNSVDTDLVRSEAFECARRTRDAIFAIEDRIADILAAENDRDKIKEILNKEHRLALDELSNMPQLNEKLEEKSHVSQ